MNENILEIMENYAKESPDYVMFSDSVTKNLTYGEFYKQAGKVYGYLKKTGIGKEDMVLICLPRGVQIIIAAAGIWRAGAAFTIVENTYAPDRIEYIRKDCSCKLVLDATVWEEIIRCKSVEGYEPFDEHAAAFAVYTSGSTGNPKGVLHEYGKLSIIVQSSDYHDYEVKRIALTPPLNFVAALMQIVYCLANRIFLYVVPYSTIKDPKKLLDFFNKEQITISFLTPSLIRKMTHKPDALKLCWIGAEPASNIFFEGLDIVNVYSMSEAAFHVAFMLLDKPYEMVPAGKSESGRKIYLLDEDGSEVAKGDEGEVCFENPYVRGYINLPEQTARVFRDGLYHTGDLGRFNEDGNLVICGRMDDMVKINGNRVEPMEIENSAKNILGIDWAAARIFDDGKKVFICLYYLDDISVDDEKVRKKMRQVLPYYMIPSFFIHIDKIPVKPSGKMDRRGLPAPQFEDYLGDYAAPRDAVEKILCEAFEKILEKDRVGIKDDFYYLGGGSLNSMEVLAYANLPGLNISDIFNGRTPEKIAEIYRDSQSNSDTTDLEEQNRKALSVSHELTPLQLYMFDYQLYAPLSTMDNLHFMFRFDKNKIVPEHMSHALETVIRQHPALATKMYFNEDGEVTQCYCPEFITPITVEPITEMELLTLKDELVAPFKLVNSRLYRVHIYETEKAGYLFFDVHHMIFDGTSFKVFIRDIHQALQGFPMAPDYYFLMVEEKEKSRATEKYLDDKTYFESVVRNDTDYCIHPEPDWITRGNSLAVMETPLDECANALSHLEQKYAASRNVVFSLITMMALSVYNDKKDVMITWTYHGRDNMIKKDECGLLLYDLPLVMHFEPQKKLSEMLLDISTQTAEGIAHDSYPYSLLSEHCLTDDITCFLYQQDIMEESVLANTLAVEPLEIRENRIAASNILDVEISDGAEGLSLVLEYNASLYNPESMERFRDLYVDILKKTLRVAESEDPVFASCVE